MYWPLDWPARTRMIFRCIKLFLLHFMLLLLQWKLFKILFILRYIKGGESVFGMPFLSLFFFIALRTVFLSSFLAWQISITLNDHSASILFSELFEIEKWSSRYVHIKFNAEFSERMARLSHYQNHLTVRHAVFFSITTYGRERIQMMRNQLVTSDSFTHTKII